MKADVKERAGDKTSAQSITGIAITGSNPHTVGMAPFEDPSWLIYACSPDNCEHGNSEHARNLPRHDQWFELHNPIADPSRPYNYLKYLENLPLVWMRDNRAMENFPGAKPYPEKELRGEIAFDPQTGKLHTKHGAFNYYMFTSSIAYMLAKAIADCEEQKIPAIGMFGIMQASKNEYEYQRPGIQYFLWEADRRGIEVIAPDISKLFHPPPDQW